MNLEQSKLRSRRSLASRLRRPTIELLETRCVLANDVAPLVDISTSATGSAGSLTARLFPMGFSRLLHRRHGHDGARTVEERWHGWRDRSSQGHLRRQQSERTQQLYQRKRDAVLRG